MRHLLLTIAFFIYTSLANAQSFSEIISLVLQNNTALKVAKSEAAAQKEMGQVGLTLADPEVEVGYLFGSPRKDVNDRVDLSVTQQFDFATLSGNKRRVAEAEAVLFDRNIDETARQLRVETALLLTEVTYCNKVLAELQRRKVLEDSLLRVYQIRLDKGDATMLDYNKAKLSVAQIDGQITRMKAERETKLVKVVGLARKDSVIFNDTVYAAASIILPNDFEKWAQQNVSRAPLIRIEDQKITISKAQMELAKSETKPSFSVGYASELVKGENYRGVKVGVQVPLWANRNKIKAAQQAQIAAEERRMDVEQQVKNEYRQLFTQAKVQLRVAEEYKTTLKNIDNSAILDKALKAGQMPLTEYLLEKKYYYENYDLWLEAERDAMIALAGIAFGL